jgi:hypothetical protein
VLSCRRVGPLAVAADALGVQLPIPAEAVNPVGPGFGYRAT